MIFSFIRGLLGGRQAAAPLASPRAEVDVPNESTVPAESTVPTVLSFRLAVKTPVNSLGAAPSASRDIFPKPPSPRLTADSRLPLGKSASLDGVKSPRPNRRRPLSLRAAGLGSAAQRRALRSIGIRTTVDLLAADASEIAQRLELPSSAAGTLRRWQRAIRLARLLPAMTPREALLLHAVHRKTLRRIAGESAPRLRRDLVRYAMSTAGSRLLADQPLPSSERVKGWVEAARKRIETHTEATE